MKKKTVWFLAAACTLALMGGCGDKGGNAQTEDTKGDAAEESQAEEDADGEEKGSSAQAQAIEYDASDYVELGDYKNLKITLGAYEVTDDDVKSNIESMLYNYPDYEDLDKDTVEDGDTVNIDYEGIKDGVAFDGAYLEIGSGSFIPGFEEGLVGKKVGEKVKLDLTFPDTYGNKELAGQAVVFNVTINKIVQKIEMTYDKITDEYITKNFAAQGYNNMEELEAGIRTQLEASNESTKATDIQDAIFDKLAEVCTIKGLPDGLLESKVTEYIEQYKSGLKANYGMEMEEYLESIGSTEEEFNQQAEEFMKESLNNQLILEAIAKKEKIDVDEEGYATYKEGIVSDYGYESEDALIEQYGEDYVKNAYLTTKTLEMLTESADITYDKNANKDAEAESAAGEKQAAGDADGEGEETEGAAGDDSVEE
jgi:trigger factor